MKRIIIFAAMFAFAACQRELNFNESEKKETAYVVFTATTEESTTKTSLNENAGNYDVVWNNGDLITIVDGADTPNVGVYSTTSTTTQADFILNSGSVATVPSYKAWYPQSLYKGDKVELPAEQLYREGNINHSPMYAESSTNSLAFKNICGIIRLNIGIPLSGKKVRSISLSADQGMSGTVSNAATLVSDAYVAAVSGNEGLTLDCGEGGVDISGPAKPFHIAVPANNYSNLVISVTTTDGITHTRTAKNTILVSRSKITDITLSLATDLSKSGTANTYMVHSAGIYKFKATVKGNGGVDPITGTTATTIDPANIRGVKVLWELKHEPYHEGKAIKYNGTDYCINYADDYVYFSTPDVFLSGDAYVAIYDALGKVLWSWLIWATEVPESRTHQGVTEMDRNLGALGTGGKYHGFAYEWGRKDPFPSCLGATYKPTEYYPYRIVAFSIEDFDSSGMTVAHSIAHPTTYPKGWNRRYWQTEEEYNSGMWWIDGKTIYDPCPAGWKVPSKDEMEKIRSSGWSLPGVGFLGNCRRDFEYGNPGDPYYWTSTGVDRDHAWGFYGTALQCDHVDNYVRSGYAIRCVKE